MKAWTAGAALLSCVFLSSAPALATTDFSRGETTVTVDANSITADSNVKYVNYTGGETINVTLDYSATCNILFSGLALRCPIRSRPKSVTGSIASVTGTSARGAASGSVTSI
jgi:hypothetical protein